jgi:hypothetical protein
MAVVEDKETTLNICFGDVENKNTSSNICLGNVENKETTSDICLGDNLTTNKNIYFVNIPTIDMTDSS